MDEQTRDRVRHEAEKHALFNALKHDSDPDVGAIMGPLMGENPEFREFGDEIASIAGPVVSSVAELSPAERKDRLAELDQEMVTELQTDDETDDWPLPELPAAESYDQVRMRLAPNPNGPWHLGNARMPAVIGTYKQLHDGWMLCRFDDTDPETKRPELDAYDAILDAIEYLGFSPDEVIKASDRLEIYYDHARNLIDLEGAYTCSCPAEHFRELKANAEACDHRNKSPDTVRSEFEAMVQGDYEPGEMVLRVKTDIEHRNPALRDWVAFRVIDTPHPRPEAAEYRCWPMLDFQSGIDDHLTEITHIIRGIDLQDSAKRQQFLYEYFDWEYPEVLHWGHVQLDAYDVPLSTSTIKKKIASGELSGWDDPRAPTIASLRRRGIRGEAIVDAMVGLGMSTSDVDLAMSTVYANNREVIDDEAPRRFFVQDGVDKPVLGGPAGASPPVHPDHPERGDRDIPVGDGVRVEADDVPPNGKRVWLKGYGCVRHTRDAFEYVGDDISAVREEDVPVIHWVPSEDAVPVRMRTMDGDVTGTAEPGFDTHDTDDVIQFERVGFVRVDAPASAEHDAVVYFSHP